MLRLVVVAAVAAALPAGAGGFNSTPLVPAFAVCPGPNTCGAPRRESRYTFDAITLRSPRTRYMNPAKPAFVVILKGVKDESGAPVTSETFTVRVTSGQINLTSQGITIPAGHPLGVVPPIPVTLRKGAGEVIYSPPAAAPPGTVVEGGGVTVYDSDGRRLALTGSHAR
jgi:hypothetical protein